MEFAIPAAPAKGKWGSPVTPVRLWHPQGGAIPEYIRTDVGARPPGLYKSESASEESDARHTSEYHAKYVEQTAVAAGKAPMSPSSAVRPRACSDPHGDARFSLPRTQMEDAAGLESHADVLPSVPSQTSINTDSAPSLHHKRFSGWSLPSVRGATPQEEEEQCGPAELEEMRFASPSPERLPRNALDASRPSSMGDLPVSRWPPTPRTNPLD
jgi:hypothetical protein